MGCNCALTLFETSNQPAKCLQRSIPHAHGGLRLFSASYDGKKVYANGMWKLES